MKVKELIDYLGEVDGDLPVAVYREYDDKILDVCSNPVSVEDAGELAFFYGNRRFAVIHV